MQLQYGLKPLQIPESNIKRKCNFQCRYFEKSGVQAEKK